MKKFLRIFLVVVLLLSVVGVMAACGEDTPAANTAGSDLPPALANVVKAEVPNLDGTAWELSGGMVDGVEMEAEDVQTVLTNFGGSMNFIYSADQKVMLTNGESALETTYTVSEDRVLYMDFNEYKYHIIFSQIGENEVMIVANKNEPNSALYFLEIKG